MSWQTILGLVVCFTFAVSVTAQQSDPAVGGAGFGLSPTGDGRIVVNRVAAGGPAEQVGIEVGDELQAVGGTSVRELTGTKLVDAIRGPVGSRVELVIIKPGKEAERVTITRAAIGPAQPPANQQRNPLAKQNDDAAVEPRKNPLAGGRDAPPAAPARGGPMTFIQQSFRDPAANNCVAVEYLVPKGWQSTGAIEWWHTYAVLAQVQLKVSDPQSGTVIEFLPLQKFAWTDQMQGLMQVGQNWMGNHTLQPITDPAEFVNQTWGSTKVLGHLRGQRPIEKQEYPAIAREAIKNDAGWTSQAVRLRYTFDNDGKPWEQDVYFTLAYGPQNNDPKFWNVQRAFTATGPRGVLDQQAATIKATIANVRATDEWLATYSVCQQLFRQGMKQSIADGVALGNSIRQYNEHIQKLSQQMHEERMKSFDTIAASQREYLGGVETYTDPYEGKGVYMPAGYKAHWVNQKGEVVLSEQEGFNPNQGDTNDWRQMVRRNPTE